MKSDMGRQTSISRKDMIDAAKHSDLALEFENASRDAGVDGQDAVRIGRRSAATWRLETSGQDGDTRLECLGMRWAYGAVYELVEDS